jgi:hypothetical protein
MSIEINGAGVITGVDSLSTPAVTNAAGSASAPSITFTGDSNTGIYSPAADTIAFTEGGVESLRIDSAGRLLVGTSSAPTSGSYNQFGKLVVQGNTFSAGTTSVLSLNRGEGAATIASGEELGVIAFGDSDGGTFGLIQCVADASAGAGDYPGRLVFSTTADGASSPTERARVTNNGYFKATSSGSYTYSASATHEFVNNSNGTQPVLRCSHTDASAPFGIYVNYTGGSPNNTSNPFFFGGDTTTTRFAVNSNGGIANYQSNNTNLSDRNAKKDISPAAGTWDCIKEWEIVNYRYKDQPDDADLNLGVIAQQVAESCPEVITVFQEATEDEPEKLGIKEQQMYWMAIKALQEAQVRIEQLEATNADLLARVTALESA